MGNRADRQERPFWAEDQGPSIFLSMGQRIRWAREMADLTQAELGEDAWLRPSSISEYERDAARPPAQAIAAIAFVLNVTADFLLCLTETPRPVRGETPFVVQKPATPS